ncbi:WD40 repeat-containing protein [Hirschfeldia incana]|nr:WD40 repeat-containing protein [Hirschfeldia incana]
METGGAGMAMCLLTDAEGTPLGSAMYIPHNAGTLQLTNLVNTFLNNEETLPYSFYVSDEELVVSVGTYMERNSVSVENVLEIVYRQQAVFRIRPVNRCSQTIAGHAGDILCLSFSPDGKQLASGSADRTVRLWDLNTATPMFTCRGHGNHVLAVAWSPDAKCLVSGDKDGKVCCWDPSNGVLQGRALEGHKRWICGIAWEPAHLSYPSRRFVTCSKDGDARIWDFTLKRTLVVLSGHTQAVTCVKWGGDGTIYTGSQDSTIRMWEITQQGQGVLRHILRDHASWVNSLGLSTEYVLRTGAFDHTSQITDCAAQFALERYIKAKGNVDSPERLVSGSDDFTIILWEPSVSLQPKQTMVVTAEMVTTATLTGHQQLVNHVSFSPNGQWIASASFDKSVKLWDGVTGNFITGFRGHVKSVYQISWSADSRMILSCSADSTLKVWDIRTKRLKHDLPGHAAEVYAVDWSPDGEKVASGGADKVLKLWKG